MKIGLINPGWEYKADPMNADFFHVPGIAYVGASLKKAGHKVTYVDFKNNPDASLEQIENCKIIGIATYLNSYDFLKKILPKLKKPKRMIIAGGPLISSYGSSRNNLLMETFPEISMGLLGEGEITFPFWIRNRKDITGKNPKSLRVENLDNLPEINYNDWPAIRDGTKGHSFNVLFSRGCYNQCSFCFRPQQGLRSFSLSRIEREIQKIEELKPRMVVIGDDVFTYNKERAMNVGRLMHKYGLPYAVESRVNDLSSELARSLAETGCRQVKFGVESFDQTVLDMAHKRIETKQIYESIKIVQDVGMEAAAFILFGLPGETKKSIETTLKGIEETRVMPRARVLIPLPGTEIYRNLVNQGKINELEMLKSYSDPAHFDTTEGNWVPINLTENVSDEELLAARDKANSFRERLGGED